MFFVEYQSVSVNPTNHSLVAVVNIKMSNIFHRADIGLSTSLRRWYSTDGNFHAIELGIKRPKWVQFAASLLHAKYHISKFVTQFGH